MKTFVFSLINGFFCVFSLAYADQFSQCATIEKAFQQDILNTIEGSLKGFTKSFNCLTRDSQKPECATLNRTSLNRLNFFRQAMKKLYQEMANQWIREESQKDGGYTKNCLIIQNNQVQLGHHIRTLKLSQSPSLCQSVLTKWSHGLDQLTSEYLNGRREIRNLDAKELKALKVFYYSPLKRILPDVALYDRRLNDRQLKQHLAMAYNKMKFGTKKLRDRIRSFANHEKYKLYEFGKQHQLFVESLSGNEKRMAEQCQQNSSFTRDCVLDVAQYASRCGSRLWNLGKELLPVIPLIDSLGEMGYVRAAEVSGLMTSREATEKRAQLITIAVFGIGGLTTGLVATGKILAKGTRSLIKSAEDRLIERLPKFKGIVARGPYPKVEKILSSRDEVLKIKPMMSEEEALKLIRKRPYFYQDEALKLGWDGGFVPPGAGEGIGSLWNSSLYGRLVTIVEKNIEAPKTKWVYHGTSTANYASIKKQGLNNLKNENAGFSGGRMIVVDGASYTGDIAYASSFSQSTAKYMGSFKGKPGKPILLRWQMPEPVYTMEIGALKRTVHPKEMEYSTNGGKTWYNLSTDP